MKNFIYFESVDGGMEAREVQNADDLQNLWRWMSVQYCIEDRTLVEWMETALVGEFKHHRLGCLVRLVDAESEKKEKSRIRSSLGGSQKNHVWKFVSCGHMQKRNKMQAEDKKIIELKEWIAKYSKHYS